jgi:hypothetical protein
MRNVVLALSLLALSACGAAATTRSATPISESSAEATEPEPTAEERELYALQEEACSLPGASSGPVTVDGVSFVCFAD